MTAPAPAPVPAPVPAPGPAVPPPPTAPGGATPEADLWASPRPADDLAWPMRLLGCLIAVAVSDPTAWFAGSALRLLLPLCALAAAYVAAPPLSARPTGGDFRWRIQLLRHRNTAFVLGSVLVAAVNRPPGWLAAVDTALLLGYLLLLDGVVAGPPGARLLRRPRALLAAVGASALVLAAALLPVHGGGAWARLLAALALIAAVATAATVLRLRRTDPRR